MINNFLFSDIESPFIIAEIGGNHEGDFGYARELVHLASESSVDTIKFQVYTGDGIVNRHVDPDRAAHFDRFALTIDQYFDLFDLSNDLGVQPVASVWNLDLIKLFAPHMPFYKIGSGDLTSVQHLKEVASQNLPIILSTGLSSMCSIRSALDTLTESNSMYSKKENLLLMQCTSSYPCNIEDANVLVTKHLENEFGYYVGYSDHTTDLTASIAAYTLGARYFEFHFTDTRVGKSFRDHKVSLTKDEILSFRGQCNLISQALGSEIKSITDAEVSSENTVSFRRALYLSKDFPEGHIVKSEDIVSLRPLNGISATDLDKVVGRKLAKNLKALEPLSLDFFI